MNRFTRDTLVVASTLAMVAIVGCSTLFSKSATPNANATTNIVYTPSATVSNIVAATQVAGSVAPAPFGTGITWVGWLFGAAVTAFAAAKTTQANTGKTMLASIIQAVEGLPPTTTATAVKQSIANNAQAKGVAVPLFALVNAHTAPNA